MSRLDTLIAQERHTTRDCSALYKMHIVSFQKFEKEAHRLIVHFTPFESSRGLQRGDRCPKYCGILYHPSAETPMFIRTSASLWHLWEVWREGV